jgi:hypothetical protein
MMMGTEGIGRSMRRERNNVKAEQKRKVISEN